MRASQSVSGNVSEPLGASEQEPKLPSTPKWPVSTGKGISQGAGPRGEGKKFAAPWSQRRGSWRKDGLGEHGQSRGFWGSHLPGKLLGRLLGFPLIPVTRRGLPRGALLQSRHLRDNGA